jgi:hypothetical protein
MEPENDPQNDLKLSELLREWQQPGATPSLDARVAAFRRRWWSFLLTGSIRVPVPVGLAVAAIVLAMAGALARRQAAAPVAPTGGAPSISLMDFRPVDDVNVRVIRGHESN